MNFLRFSNWRGRAIAAAAVCGIAALLAFRFVALKVPPVPHRTLRIGFEDNPPVQTRTAHGLSGLSVETVSEAARRSGLQLEWVETRKSSDDSLREHLVDLWPLMVDLPDRRKFVHFARPWMHSSYVLVSREGTQVSDRDFKGTVAVFHLPLHVRMLGERFPEARIVETSNIRAVITQVCTGAVGAGFYEMRAAQIELGARPPECASVALRLHVIPGLTLRAGVASTPEAAGAADRIQDEIGNMFRDGSLAMLIAKYSYFGLDDTWASYERTDAEQRMHWLTWTGIGLALVVGVVLWQASSLRQRKRAEVALRESEERFRNLANTAPVMIVASGADGQATFFNKTWLDFTGRTLEEELGAGWTENLHPEDRDRAWAEYSSCLTARGDCSIEYRLRRADGEYRHIICTGVARFGPDGAFAGYIASCIDLTEIKIAQEEASARQNLESLGVLAGGIAHDFNNLLGGMLSYAELAELKYKDGTPPDGELKQIREVALRGSEIVRELMVFAGKESGSPEPLDVSLLVGEMLELLKVSISKRAALRISLGEGLPAVLGNPAQIRQVVMNLVTNASEALGEGDGMIRVGTQCVRVSPSSNLPEAKGLAEGKYLRLEVSDTGCGMSPENQRRIFDPFFTTKFVGRGMGLAVVQRIVRGLGGTVHVVSSPGTGTSFRIMLPCAAEPVSAKHGHVATRPRPAKAQLQPAGTVLVVEDEETLLFAVSKLLRRRGFSVIEASNGSSALEVIRDLETGVDAMLLDFTLPGVPSGTVLEEAVRLRPDLVPILTSAYSGESVRDALTGLAVENFIRKPFHIDALMDLLQDSLNARASAAQGA